MTWLIVCHHCDWMCQLLPRGGGGAGGLRPDQTTDVPEPGQVATGAEGTRRELRSHHAGWQQDWPPASTRCHHGGGESPCWWVWVCLLPMGVRVFVAHWCACVCCWWVWVCLLPIVCVWGGSLLLWTDPGLKSGISLHKLISTLNKQKKKINAGWEWIVKHSPKPLACKENDTDYTGQQPPPLPHQSLWRHTTIVKWLIIVK